MKQFNCPFCEEGFEQLSKFKQHMRTSHPDRSTSAVDMGMVLDGVDFPKTREELVEVAKSKNMHDEVINSFKSLPVEKYRDSAEVMRAFSELKTDEEKPSYQPSKKGGKETLKSFSAANMASVFKGIQFPKSADELKKYARGQTENEELVQVLENFHDKTYKDMADIEKEFSLVMS